MGHCHERAAQSGRNDFETLNASAAIHVVLSQTGVFAYFGNVAVHDTSGSMHVLISASSLRIRPLQ